MQLQLTAHTNRSQHMKVRITLTFEIDPDKVEIEEWPWKRKPGQQIIREAFVSQVIDLIADAVDTPEIRESYGIEEVTFQ